MFKIEGECIVYVEVVQSPAAVHESWGRTSGVSVRPPAHFAGNAVTDVFKGRLRASAHANLCAEVGHDRRPLDAPVCNWFCDID